MKLEVHEVALDMIGELRPLVAAIAREDRSLAEQLKRAGSSVALTLGEGVYSRKGNRAARFQEALASAGETRTALRLALAWGYVSEPQLDAVFHLIDRIVAMCWRLTHARH